MFNLSLYIRPSAVCVCACAACDVVCMLCEPASVCARWLLVSGESPLDNKAEIKKVREKKKEKSRVL